METIYKEDYKNDGIFINLETTFKPYENLLYNHYKYLDKSKKYYLYCDKGVASKKAGTILDAYGYDVTRVINRPASDKE